MSDSSKAGYATNVRHYAHVLDALIDDYDDVRFIGPAELAPATLDRLRPWLPPRVWKTLNRRRAGAVPDGVQRLRSSVGSGAPALTRLFTGRTMSPDAIRWSHSIQAKAVSSRFDGAEFVQAVEGLAHVAMRRESARSVVLERRNLHHAAFEADIDVHAGFPFTRKLDPIRDYLEEEYEGADMIVVYSEVAKRSFVERGLAAARIWVNPLPVRTEPVTLGATARDPHQLLYVGRLDAYKGVDVAVAAVQQLPEPYRLIVAGPGGIAEQQWIARQPRVEYRGVLSAPELQMLYSTAGLLLSPSIESFGLAVLEASQHGLAVMTRETTGISDYLSPEVLTVVPTRAPEIWADAIESHKREPVIPQLAGALSYHAAVSNQRALNRKFRN